MAITGSDMNLPRHRNLAVIFFDEHNTKQASVVTVYT